MRSSFAPKTVKRSRITYTVLFETFLDALKGSYFQVTTPSLFAQEEFYRRNDENYSRYSWCVYACVMSR
jgi:hypothetical protein